MQLYNTLTRRKEEFKSANNNQVKIYACGPTVYDFAHIGHFRAYIFVDVLRRVLCYNDYQLNHVMNITDVGHLTDDADAGEDKIEKKAANEQKTVWDIAKFYTDDFFAAMDALNVERPEVICKATDHITEMIDMVKLIEKNGYAYKTSDGVYFDTSKLDDYGKLARLNIDELKEGARVEKNPEKRNPTDFALWKFSPAEGKRQMEWESPWSKSGFPGWHIECTAMAVKYLGQSVDIHTGGIDHIPVHHTNEIAQAQGAFGKDIVRFWMHNEFLLVDGQKMSKSKKNFYTMKDVRKHNLNPLSVRYFFLLAHYRTQVNFTWEGLEAARNAFTKLCEKIQGFKRSPSVSLQNQGSKINNDKAQNYKKEFERNINDDLNTARGLAVLWEMLKDDEVPDEEKLALALDFDKVLGLRLDKVKAVADVKIPSNIQKLIDEREQTRKDKDFARSDELRDKIAKAGFDVQDTADGQVVKKMANKR